MNILIHKVLFLVLMTFCYDLDLISAQNDPNMLTIPIITTNILGPRKFERIIVPVYPSLPRPKDEEDEKPVTEKVMDIADATPEFRLSTKKPPPLPKHPDEGNMKKHNEKSYSYVTRTDGFGAKLASKSVPKIVEQKFSNAKDGPEHRSSAKPNEISRSQSKVIASRGSKSKPTQSPKAYEKPHEIQPLHITTIDFEQTKPNHNKPSPEERKKHFQNQEENLKLKNLPENPDEVPKTDWFDNLGKYNYGIIHAAQKNDENASLEDAAEDESKESPKEAQVTVKNPQVVVQHPQTVSTTDPNTSNFKSNFNDPKLFGSVHQQNTNNGGFLYKSEVYYPNYRDHLYLPFTTYYGDANIFPKQFPVVNTHTVYHTPQVVQEQDVNHHNNKATDAPIKVSLPIPQESPKSTKSPVPPKKVYPPVVHKKEPQGAPRKPLPSRKPVEKQQPPVPPAKNNQKNEEEEEEGDYDEEEGDNADIEDYEEGDSVEEDEGSNDKVQSESSEDYDDEEDEEELPKYTYSGFRSRNGDESSVELDDFDKAWKKYGYYGSAKQVSSEENESSESRLVPVVEVEPERKKIVLMKMEYHRGPYDGLDLTEAESTTEQVKAKTRHPREMKSKMSGTINNNEKAKKKRKKNKKTSVKSQQHPNAGPDDLKFFQYFNYLGNGEHRAGGRVGNDKHYIEQHERGSKVAGAFQKKVKWADKDGGFGEHYWDLNHGK